MSDVRLRPVGEDDEAIAQLPEGELASDGFSFLLNHDPAEPWPAYVERLGRQRRGLDLPPGTVPAAFLFAHLGPVVIGRVSIRFALTPWLRDRGGHIGYCIRPAFRRRGYGREVLHQALIVARAEGVASVLLVCDDYNTASAALILNSGGVEDPPFVDETGQLHRRFWID